MTPKKKFRSYTEIKGRLRSVRKTQTDLALKLQISYDTLQHYLSGRRIMPEKVKIKIERIISDWENV